MKGKLRELMAWELQDNWSFPILEIVIAITIIQVVPFTTILINEPTLLFNFVRTFFESMFFVIIISAAIVCGKSFASGIEERKLVLLLSYPPSRSKVFLAKYLTNFLMLFLIFGSALLVEGASLFLFFSGAIQLIIWAFMFLYLFLAVFLTSSLMTIIALAVKRFGLSVLVFLIFMFGIEYSIPVNVYDPTYYLTLKMGPQGGVGYATAWYAHLLGLPSSSWVRLECFTVATSYLLIGGLAFLLGSLLIMKKLDLD
ncbi:MAG TPA: hypothetical protein VIH48_01670 [Candidatus Bathyarchaeia archaeon]